MKKKLSLILMLLLICALAFTLAACDKGGGGTDTGEDEGKDPEVATFQVTFDSDGGTSLADFNTKVEYGQTVSEPKNSDGVAIVPAKTGYTFNGWTSGSSSTAFVFDSTPITATTTIKASWVAKTYTMTVALTDGGSVDADDVYLTTDGTETGEAVTTQTLTYAVKGTLQIPKTKVADDYFVYWYYKDNGEEVRLTSWATKGTAASTVSLLAVYKVDAEMTIYAKWHSCLNDYTVTFDSKGGASVAAATVKELDGVTEPTAPTRAGYDFDYWYYIKTVDDEDVETEFTFASSDNHYEVSADITLYARWAKKIEITSATDLETLRSNLLSDDNYEYVHANIYIKSNITLTDWSALFTDVAFEGTLDGAVYDSDGTTVLSVRTITISSYEIAEYMTFIGNNNGKIKNIKVAATVSAAALPSDFDENVNVIYLSALTAVNTGNITGATVTLTGNVAFGRTLVLGGVAAKNDGGEISASKSTVSLTELSADNVTAGGILGVSTGGAVYDVSADFTVKNGTELAADADVLFLGGVAGKVLGGSLKTAWAKTTEIKAGADDAYVGGVVGYLFNSTANQICGTTVKLDVTAINCFVGGAVGENLGVLYNCELDLVTVVTTASGVNVTGGIVGRNYNEGASRGQIKYVFVKDGTVSATATGTGKVYSGAVAGQSVKGVISMIYTGAQITVTTGNAVSIGRSVGNNDKDTSYSKLYYDAADALTLNGVAYAVNAETGEANFSTTAIDAESGITTGNENILSETWVKANLSFNPDYDADNPDKSDYIWTLSSGTTPSLTFTLVP